MSFLTSFFAVLTSPTGSAIYHILTFFALEAAFAIAIGHLWRRGSSANSGRLAFAAGLAGVARGVLFLLGALSTSGLFAASAILPPLDRAVALLTIILLAWSLTFRKGAIFSDTLMAFSVIGVIVALIATGIQWYPFGASGNFYNPYDTIWGFAKLIVILITLLSLLIVRQQDWVLAFFIFVTLLFGVGLHLLSPISTENFPASERMAELIALPLFAVILYRHALGAPPPVPAPVDTVAATPEAVVAPPPIAVEAPIKHNTLTPQAATALAYIALATQENIVNKVTEAVGKTMLADLTLVFSPPDANGKIACIGGYDLIRENNIDGFTIAATKINTVASAIQRGRPLRMRLSAHRSELLAIADALYVSLFDSAAMIPLRSSEKNFGGIMIVAPHSQKDWTNEEHALLASLATPIAQALLKAADTSAEQATSQQLQTERDHSNKLTNELELVKEELRQTALKASSLAAVIQAQPDSTTQAEIVESLTQKLTQAQDQIKVLGEVSKQNLAQQEELTSLQQQLATAQAELQKAKDSQETIAKTFDDANQKEVQRLSDETAALNQQLANAQREIQKLNETHAVALASNNVAHRDEIQRLIKDLAALTEQLGIARAKINELSATSETALSDTDKMDELQRLHKEVASLSQQSAGAELEIQALRQENKQLSEIRSSALYSSLASQSSEIAARIQELRQPLASIVGYTDMLLSESIGILGTLQKSLMERIKVSTERMTLALDDLSHTAAISSNTGISDRGSTQVFDVIEDAVSEAFAQFHDKDIHLELNVSDSLPNVHAEHDAVHQILVRLLTNACTVSAPNSEVKLIARSQNDEYILISVSDSGTRLAPEEQERIFSRIYRDSGLNVAKALIEANEGRIWIDSSDKGNTISLLLPTHHANPA